MSDTIYTAMARVSDAIRYIQRRGRNDAQKYNYVMESDVKEAFHREFARQGILFLPTVEDCTIEPHVKGSGDKQERSGYLATIRLRVVLALAKSDPADEVASLADGLEYQAVAIGQGYDSTDKAVNKAYTSAIKNFLLATFLVPSGDDVERDEDGQPMNQEAMDTAFEDIAKAIKAVEPMKNAHKAKIADVMAYYKTEGGRPVDHPREFKSRADAVSCLAALRGIERIWAAEQLKAEAESGQAREQAADLFDNPQPSTTKKAIKA